jgi:putative oxidoreductase
MRANAFLLALARLLMSSLFIWDGIGQLNNPPGTLRYFTSVHVPVPDVAVWVSIAIHLVGGLALLAGFCSRWAACLLALVSLGTAFGVHLPAGDQDNMIHFYKNLAMTGGFLYVFAIGLGAVATTRLATMAPAVPIAVAGTLIFGLSTIPAFIVIEVLLPLAQGFEMFAIAVAPVLFGYALLMACKKTMLIGFFSALLFASAGQFQNRMNYNPVDLINTSIAAVAATGCALVLWAIVAPQTPEAARRRFVRAARRVFARIASPRAYIGLAEFETAMAEALTQLRGYLRDDLHEDIAIFETGLALLGAGRDLIRMRESVSAVFDLKPQIARLDGHRWGERLDLLRRIAQEAGAKCLADLRNDALAPEEVQAATQDLGAFASMAEELERSGALFTDETNAG